LCCAGFRRTLSAMNYGPATGYEMAREFPSEPPEIRFEVADVFRAYGADYREKHNLSGRQLAAMTAIERCRTTVCGVRSFLLPVR